MCVVCESLVLSLNWCCHCPSFWRVASVVPHGPHVYCKVATTASSLLGCTTITTQMSKMNQWTNSELQLRDAHIR